MGVQTHTHPNNGTENNEDHIFTLSTDINYSNSSNNKNTNTDTGTTFKISTRSIVSSTNESKPGPSVKLLGGFDFYL